MIESIANSSYPHLGRDLAIELTPYGRRYPLVIHFVGKASPLENRFRHRQILL
jgi:hypothetical protein